MRTTKIKQNTFLTWKKNFNQKICCSYRKIRRIKHIKLEVCVIRLFIQQQQKVLSQS